MFNKIILRSIKKGDILIVNPSKERVKVIKFIKSEAMTIFLWNYWRKKHNIEVPTTFKIAVCQFATYVKNYNYPINKLCVKKPLLQKNHRLRWKMDRENHIAEKRGDHFLNNLRRDYNEYLEGEHNRKMFERV